MGIYIYTQCVWYPPVMWTLVYNPHQLVRYIYHKSHKNCSYVHLNAIQRGHHYVICFHRTNIDIDIEICGHGASMAYMLIHEIYRSTIPYGSKDLLKCIIQNSSIYHGQFRAESSFNGQKSCINGDLRGCHDHETDETGWILEWPFWIWWFNGDLMVINDC